MNITKYITTWKGRINKSEEATLDEKSKKVIRSKNEDGNSEEKSKLLNLIIRETFDSVGDGNFKEKSNFPGSRFEKSKSTIFSEIWGYQSSDSASCVFGITPACKSCIQRENIQMLGTDFKNEEHVISDILSCDRSLYEKLTQALGPSKVEASKNILGRDDVIPYKDSHADNLSKQLLYKLGVRYCAEDLDHQTNIEHNNLDSTVRQMIDFWHNSKTMSSGTVTVDNFIKYLEQSVGIGLTQKQFQKLKDKIDDSSQTIREQITSIPDEREGKIGLKQLLRYIDVLYEINFIHISLRTSTPKSTDTLTLHLSPNNNNNNIPKSKNNHNENFLVCKELYLFEVGLGACISVSHWKNLQSLEILAKELKMSKDTEDILDQLIDESNTKECFSDLKNLRLNMFTNSTSHKLMVYLLSTTANLRTLELSHIYRFDVNKWTRMLECIDKMTKLERLHMDVIENSGKSGKCDFRHYDDFIYDFTNTELHLSNLYTGEWLIHLVLSCKYLTKLEIYMDAVSSKWSEEHTPWDQFGRGSCKNPMTHSSIRHLVLHNFNNLHVHKLMLHLLDRGSQLETLMLSHIKHIGHKEWQTVIDSIKNMKHLHTLTIRNLSYQREIDEYCGTISLLRTLPTMKSLRTLGVVFKTKQCLNVLQKCLKKCPHLRTIHYYCDRGIFKELDDNTEKNFCSTLVSCLNIQEIFLYAGVYIREQQSVNILLQVVSELTEEQRKLITWTRVATKHYRQPQRIKDLKEFKQYIPCL